MALCILFVSCSRHPGVCMKLFDGVQSSCEHQDGVSRSETSGMMSILSQSSDSTNKQQRFLLMQCTLRAALFIYLSLMVLELS